MIVTTADHTTKTALAAYDLVPMNLAQAAHLEDLAQALAEGHIVPDTDRKNFFDIMSGNRWFYVHIEPSTEAAYLIAHRPRNAWQN